MRICILCEADKLEEVRQTQENENILKIKLSPTGTEPATHYFCTMAVNQEKANRLLAKRKLTTMEIAEPAEFLTQRGLKIIK
jgi:hypothetical protein